MTTITLNLLAEEQRVLEARARDPFKVAVVLGVLAVTLSVVAGTIVSFVANKHRTRAQQLRQEHAALGESAIAEAEIRYRWTESLSQDIVSLNTTRILFADQMALVKDLMPPSIQLASLTLRLDTKTQQLQPPPPAAAGGESVARPAKPRRPKKLEVLTMRFEGQAVGDRPEMEVDGFLNKVREDNVFALTLDDVQLQSIARASLTDPKTGFVSDPRAFFVVECTLRGEQ